MMFVDIKSISNILELKKFEGSLKNIPTASLYSYFNEHIYAPTLAFILSLQYFLTELHWSVLTREFTKTCVSVIKKEYF